MFKFLLVLLSTTPSVYAQDVPVPMEEAVAPAVDEATPEHPAPVVEADPDAGKEPVQAAAPEDPKKELPAVAVPADEAEAIEDIQKAVDAVRTGQWATFLVLLLGLLVFLYNKFVGSKQSVAKPESE